MPCSRNKINCNTTCKQYDDIVVLTILYRHLASSSYHGADEIRIDIPLCRGIQHVLTTVCRVNVGETVLVLQLK